MEVSSSTANAPTSTAPTQLESSKQNEEAQERVDIKEVESANEESQQVTAQKTGVGNSVNLTA